MIYKTDTKTLSQWLSENQNEKSIEFVGELDIDTINQYSDLILNSNIKFVDISLCKINFDAKSQTINTIEDYISDYFEFIDEKISAFLKLFVNTSYSNSFATNQGIITSVDKKLLVHISDNQEIIVPDEIEIIGKCVFSGYQANKITLPSSLKEIGDYCFANTDNLEALDLPKSIEKLGISTFLYTNVDELVIPDKVEVLPYECCKMFGEVKLPKSLKILEDFNAIFSEEPLFLPEGLEYLGSWSINAVSELHIPSSVKHIKEDFYYDYICGEPDEKPKLIISPENKYFYTSANKYLGRYYVENLEEQTKLSEYAIRFISNESDKKKYEGKILSSLEMMQLVNQMPETNDLHRRNFYYAMYQTSILNDEEREFLEYLRYKERIIWKQMHFIDETKTIVMYGINANGNEDFIKDYQNWYARDLRKDYETLSGKYTKIICRQYSKQDTEYKNPLGQFEVTDDGMAINNVSFTLPKCPEKFQKYLN